MSFNYNQIPVGFYDKIFDSADGVRKYWHWHKFDSVHRSYQKKAGATLLDVGCFSGSFIGRFLNNTEIEATGIDILPSQVEYANHKFQGPHKHFFAITDFKDATQKLTGRSFDVVTFIEVIEHLNPEQINSFFEMLDSITHPGSQVIITTPNYLSLWPVLEFFLNHFSDVTYEEQHIVKFNYFNFEQKLSRMVPHFEKKYNVSLKTTSHFITPLVAAFSYNKAIELSTHIDPLNWKNPFGSILILRLIKK